MARKIATLQSTDCTRVVRVMYDGEFGEYQCRLQVDGTALPDATYYTDNKQDALCTARAMCETSLSA